MLSFLQKYFRGILLLLFGLLGLALGHLAAAGLGIYLNPPIRLPEARSAQLQAAMPKATLGDYETILQRNIFDSTATGPQQLATVQETSTAAPAAETTRSDLTLLGTVAAGPDSLALIRADRETQIYHLDDEVPGGGQVLEIERNLVRIRAADGTTQVLPIHEGEKRSQPTRSSRRSRAAARDSNIKSVGENRWVIPREEVEKARGNLNELLRQARMEPQIVNGKTEGFIVRMIQRNSLLAHLGIRRGDVVMNVNGVELDSPEKALQIFQQLREAKNISIGLSRGGKLMNFDYEIN